MNNQFIDTPLLALNPHKTKIQLQEKDDLINNLELKNQKLKKQVLKIRQRIEQTKVQIEEDVRVKKRQSILQTNMSSQAMKKQLDNAYKKIKIYEYEIIKLQEKKGNQNFSSRIGKLEHIIKEKRFITLKLKKQYIKEEKIMNQNTKKLCNNTEQQEYQKRIKLATEQQAYLRETIKKMENKTNNKQENMKKQFYIIKNLEKQLVEKGMVAEQLTDIRQRAFNRYQQIPPNESKNVHEEIQDRTRTKYESLRREIALLEKVQADQDKYMNQAEEERKQAAQRNLYSRNKLLQCQNELEQLEIEIVELKKKVVPSNLKPLNPIRSMSSYHTPQSNKINLSKNINKSTKTLQHSLKYDEVGIITIKGQRFTDRNVLGKSNFMTKITEIIVYIDKNRQLIAGFQCIYNGHKRGGNYIKKEKEGKEKTCEEQKFICIDKTFIKNIGGTLDQQDKLQSLHIINSNGQSHRFGRNKTIHKSFQFDINPDQFPVCVFGSLLIIKDTAKPQYSLIEHFGVQINTQSKQSQFQ